MLRNVWKHAVSYVRDGAGVGFGGMTVSVELGVAWNAAANSGLELADPLLFIHQVCRHFYLELPYTFSDPGTLVSFLRLGICFSSRQTCAVLTVRVPFSAR